MVAIQRLHRTLSDGCAGAAPPAAAAHTPRPGVASELSVIYLALPYVRQRQMYCVLMPNPWNFALDVTVLICVVAMGYILGLPMARPPPLPALMLSLACSCTATCCTNGGSTSQGRERRRRMTSEI